MLRQIKDCRDKVPLPFALNNVVTGVKSVATVFFTHFFSSVATEKFFVEIEKFFVATEKFFVTTKFYFFLEFSLDFVAT